MPDLVLRPARGLPDGLVIPEAELVERFSRSSGPGGQGVNTTDSKVELRWDLTHSSAVSAHQRSQLLDRLAARVDDDGVVSIVASEHRSQWQNRSAARARLRALLAEALEPPAPARRPTRPSRAARQRRLDDKRRRGELKARRRVPPLE